MIKLHPFQQRLSDDIDAAWRDGSRNVLCVSPTGSGKTVLFSHKLAKHDGASCAIAHRRELVGQMSVTLARFGIRHRLVIPTAAIGDIVQRHIQETGKSYYSANALCGVASAHTLPNRDLDVWAGNVTLWICDEAHHVLRDNLWGKAVARFPRARGLGVTATAVRSDGKGLGTHADGVFDRMVVGPSPRDLIERGFLCDYRIFAPQSDLDLTNVAVSGTTGDFVPKQLAEATKRSRVTGDIVENYGRSARGMLGITFATSVELASETAARFRAAGVPAECVSAETPDLLRSAIMRRFMRREILQLVNVDLFGEGTDVPALEVVSMGRATASFGLYAQQFGRVMRTLEGKTHGLVLDHVGNVLRHGLPDAPREWSLDRRERRSRGGQQSDVPIRACAKCAAVYERFRICCPMCGHTPVPQSRTAPEHVDGDLTELDASTLARLRGDMAKADDAPLIPYGATPEVKGAIWKRHRERTRAQADLRSMMALWSGWQQHMKRTDAEQYRRFYHGFGVDVLSAQTLAAREADELTVRIQGVLDAAGVVQKGEAAMNTSHRIRVTRRCGAVEETTYDAFVLPCPACGLRSCFVVSVEVVKP